MTSFYHQVIGLFQQICFSNHYLSKPIVMQRRKFIQQTLATAPLLGMVTVPPYDKKSNVKQFIVRAGKDRFDQPILYKGVNPNLVKISAKDTGGQLAVFEYIGLEKAGPTLHVHFDQDEIFYVSEGEFLFQVGDEKHLLQAGDTIFLPRKVPHTWVQRSEEGRLIYLLQPAGKMEEFFQKVDALKGQGSKEVFDKIHAEHGMKVVGPPLPVE
jgi:quercetin 2,3-dioxygenase